MVNVDMVWVVLDSCEYIRVNDFSGVSIEGESCE